MPYRRFFPGDAVEQPYRMLFGRLGPESWEHSIEADSWAGLMAGLVQNAEYEDWDEEHQVQERIRVSQDLMLLCQLQGIPVVRRADPADSDPPLDQLDLRTDERFLRSLHRHGFVALAPSMVGGASAADEIQAAQRRPEE